MMLRKVFHDHILKLQDLISGELRRIDPEIQLTEDHWEKDHGGNPGGGGRTKCLGGPIIENAGVNTSLVFGEVSPEFASKLKGKSTTMWATEYRSLSILPESLLSTLILE